VGPPPGGAGARRADAELAAIHAELPAGSILVVAAPGDGSAPHLHVIVVSGPGYRAGLLDSAATRQPGLVLLTDLTPTVLGWFGTRVPSAVVGSPITRAGRGSLAGAIGMLKAQDTAAQVYQGTIAPFRLFAGFGEGALFAPVWLVPWGRGEDRGRRRRALARAVGAWAGALPVGTFLAGLVPWPALPHPAVVLYSVAVAWTALVAGIALAGPWRRDPLGTAGFVAAITVGVMAVDMMTGSHLMRETPFGLSALVTGRYYGLGNNGVVVYGASGILCAAWLGAAALRRGSRQRALAVMAAVAVVTVAAAAWPGFGAKVGGTIAVVPGFLVLLAAAAGVKLTARRWALVVVSGLALVAVFALATYLVPVTAHSDIGSFVGQSLHGGAGGTLRRKISSNLGSLAANPWMPAIPVVIILLGALVAWPARLRAGLLARAYERIPLLQATLSAIWLVGVLGWFAEDSGVTVPVAGQPPRRPGYGLRSTDKWVAEGRVKYRVSRVLAGPFLHLLWRPQITGGEHIPLTGGAILASNHLSVVDSIFLPLLLARPVTFAAKSEYFTGTSPGQRFTAAYMRATKQLSVDRAGARAAQETLQAALELLQAGELFGIYPEGTRSPDGRLYRGRTGVGWLALASGVPVIPVAMVGTERVLPPGHAVPAFHRVGIRVGKPLTFDGYRDARPAARARRAVTDEVMNAIRDLSGQEYVPMYASARKDELQEQASRPER
jgi:1-acyl-sn-glycerol-3-phosphate acyltransferase